MSAERAEFLGRLAGLRTDRLEAARLIEREPAHGIEALGEDAAAFGERVVSKYIAVIERAGHPFKTFDALFGLAAIALAHPRAAPDIAAEVRRRPVGRTIAYICMDLGIAPGLCEGAFWNQVEKTLRRYGGSLNRLYQVRARREDIFQRERVAATQLDAHRNVRREHQRNAKLAATVIWVAEHRALREADEGQLRFIETACGQLLVEEMIEDERRLADAGTRRPRPRRARRGLLRRW